MNLEAVIDRVWRYTWRLWSSEFGDTHFEDRDRVNSRCCNHASLEIPFEAMIERVWICTWRAWWCKIGVRNRATLDLNLQEVDGRRAGCWDSFHQLVNLQPWECDMWLYLWAVMESWLMAVDRAGRQAGSWRYIQGSTRNHENEGKKNNLRWILYSAYAVLGVNSWSWHGEIERDNLTLCSAMMMELWTKKREMGDDDENDVEDTSRYEISGVQLAWLGC